MFLESCISPRKLTSLDEATSTIVTLTTASLAAIALFVEGMEYYFGVTTFVSMFVINLIS